VNDYGIDATRDFDAGKPADDRLLGDARKKNNYNNNKTRHQGNNSSLVPHAIE